LILDFNKREKIIAKMKEEYKDIQWNVIRVKAALKSRTKYCPTNSSPSATQ